MAFRRNIAKEGLKSLVLFQENVQEQTEKEVEGLCRKWLLG